MLDKYTEHYDVIYHGGGKDYTAEARQLHVLIVGHKRSIGNRLLDVACGTGGHLAHLQDYYEVEGLDLSEQMLERARRRCPGVPFHLKDMVDFDLGRQFDVVTCLFSAIARVKTVPRLQRAIQSMARHVHPGGVMIVEPFFTVEQFRPGWLHAVFIDQPDLKVARMHVSEVEGRIAILPYHYLVATSRGVEYVTERHEYGLFSREEYAGALSSCGLEVVDHPRGLTGRGLYLGVKPSASGMS